MGWSKCPPWKVDTLGHSMTQGKKCFCSDDEKREICGEARVAGESVVQVAQRYAMKVNVQPTLAVQREQV